MWWRWDLLLLCQAALLALLSVEVSRVAEPVWWLLGFGRIVCWVSVG